MKLFLTILFIAASAVLHAQLKTGTLLLGGGMHITHTQIEGSNSILTSNRQLSVAPSGKAMLLFNGNKKTAGLWLGASSNSVELNVSYKGSANSSGKMIAGGSAARFELGYHIMSKKIYVNNIMAQSDITNKGIFVQIQPLVGISYLYSNYSGVGSIGGGDVTLTAAANRVRSLGLVYGGNIYVGKNDKTWFFINIMGNTNVAQRLNGGTLTSTINGTTTKNTVRNNGNGIAFTAGIVLYKFKYKK